MGFDSVCVPKDPPDLLKQVVLASVLDGFGHMTIFYQFDDGAKEA